MGKTPIDLPSASDSAIGLQCFKSQNVPEGDLARRWRFHFYPHSFQKPTRRHHPQITAGLRFYLGRMEPTGITGHLPEFLWYNREKM